MFIWYSFGQKYHGKHIINIFIKLSSNTSVNAGTKSNGLTPCFAFWILLDFNTENIHIIPTDASVISSRYTWILFFFFLLLTFI